MSNIKNLLDEPITTKMRMDYCKECLKINSENGKCAFITESDDLLLNVLFQACGFEGDMLDNSCLSDYEKACSYLERKGYLKSKNGRIYSITNKGKEIGYK